jgi:hypothetical protein
MIEHVGHEYMDDFFACCESHLAEEGILVVQVSTAGQISLSTTKYMPDSIIITNNNKVYICLVFDAQEELGHFLSDWQKNPTKDTSSYPSKFLGLHDHELTFICKYIHVCSVHLSSRGTVRPIQKKAKLHKRIHIPWRLPSFFGSCNVCHVRVIKVLVRFISIDQILDWLLHGD